MDRSHERDADTGLREPFELNDGSRARRTLWRYVRPAATTVLILAALTIAALGILQLRDWVVVVLSHPAHRHYLDRLGDRHLGAHRHVGSRGRASA